MNAAPVLLRIAKAIDVARLDVVLIGNAAAALQGAPVTTLVFDFMFRKTRTNMRKLKVFAQELGAVILRPYYPASSLYRVVNDDTGLQVDFLATIHGVRSFESLRSRARPIAVSGVIVLVASLADILRSKRAAGRPKDHAGLDVLEATLEEAKKRGDS